KCPPAFARQGRRESREEGTGRRVQAEVAVSGRRVWVAALHSRAKRLGHLPPGRTRYPAERPRLPRPTRRKRTDPSRPPGGSRRSRRAGRSWKREWGYWG